MNTDLLVTSPRVPTAPDENRQTTIAKLVNSISTLSSMQFVVMVQQPNTKYTKTILRRILGDALSTTVLEWPDHSTILRMFWLVNIAHDELSERSDDDFEFYKKAPENILHLLHDISETDRAVLEKFEDRQAIMENMYAYRKVLFTKHIIPTKASTQDSDDVTVGDKLGEQVISLNKIYWGVFTCTLL